MKNKRLNTPEYSSLKFIFTDKPRGFALIATISVMVLLIMIALAMLTLSTTTQREYSHTKHQETARANARMALMLALGELQQGSGADQRVTATADIVDGALEGHKHWTGFWSTENWDSTSPDERTFLGWGVSHPARLDSIDDIETEIPITEKIRLVGPGSVLDTDDYVVAHRIPVKNDSNPSGHYAWWIGDEGVKASYSAPRLGSQPWNQASLMGIPAKTGVSSLDLPGDSTFASNYSELSTNEITASSASRKSLNAALNDASISRRLFHDVTPQAVTLLTDTRNGGVRRDLSTAFELERSTFNAITEFHASGEQNATEFYDELTTAYNDARFYHADKSPDIGYVCEIPHSTGFVRGPSWDLVRNHYRLYKKEWEDMKWARQIKGVDSSAFVARGSLPHSYSGKLNGDNDKVGDVFGYHHSNGTLYSKSSYGSTASIQLLDGARRSINSSRPRTIARSPKLTPSVVRVSVALGLVKKILDDDGWSLAISFHPFLTIMNPYNVPIAFDSIGLWATKFNPVKVTINYTDENDEERTMIFGQYFSHNEYSEGSFTLRLAPSFKPHTLEPGEVRVISPTKIDALTQLKRRGISSIRGSFAYSEDSELYYAPNDGIKPKEDTTVTVTLDGRNESFSVSDRMIVTLDHKKSHVGGFIDFLGHVPPSKMHGDLDIFDQPLICNLGVNSNNDRIKSNFFVQRAVNTNQIPREGESGLYLGVYDIQMKTTSEDFPSLTLNPRGAAFDTRDYEGSNRSSPQWKAELIPLTDLTQLQLVANPTGQAFWGEGRTVTAGDTHCPLYEIPELPLTSISQLQHLNTGITGSSGSLQIGNSFPHPGIANLEQIATQRSTVTGGYSAVESQVLSDMAWASNEALWDRYFFSGINWGDATSPHGGDSQPYSTHQAAVDALVESNRANAWPLQNPRMDLINRNLNSSQKNDLRDYDKLANYLAVFGGFNVNSTSKNAWKAIFSSLRQIDVRYRSGSSSTSLEAANVFSRFLIPTGVSGEMFGSFRELNDSEIDTLAEQMVRQVKTRGPFMGLSDFVNRRLKEENIDGTDTAACGALQAAIEAAGLNGTAVNQRPTATNIENVSYQVAGNDKDISNYAGASGYLLQADILNSIGGILSARSDTFTIRAYGSATDSAGNVLAEARCEATVQRIPEWVVPTDQEPNQLTASPATSPTSPIHTIWEKNISFPELNRSLGRRFKVQSFRWLAANEV